jgi:hypothetical protein
MLRRTLTVFAVAAIALGAGVAQAEMTELAVNGGFETGDFEGWSLFPTGDDQFSIVTPGSGSTYAARIFNEVSTSAALMKNANIGIGIVEPIMTVTISFDARGSLMAGGVAFAEFFSELEGGGVSQSEILGGAPLALNPDPEVWTTFEFTTTTGPDVSGGVTLQLTATTGADPSSVADMYYDNISVIVDAVVSTDATSWSGIKNLYR